MSEIKEAKSLRWLAIQFPLVENPKDDIEKLQSCINLYCTAAAEKIEQLTEENERLRAENEIKSQKRANIFEIANAYERGKADTVREMQERLMEAPIKVGLPLFGLQTKDEVEDYANELILQMRDTINQIAKEMVGG